MPRKFQRAAKVFCFGFATFESIKGALGRAEGFSIFARTLCAIHNFSYFFLGVRPNVMSAWCGLRLSFTSNFSIFSSFLVSGIKKGRSLSSVSQPAYLVLSATCRHKIPCLVLFLFFFNSVGAIFRCGTFAAITSIPLEICVQAHSSPQDFFSIYVLHTFFCCVNPDLLYVTRVLDTTSTQRYVLR